MTLETIKANCTRLIQFKGTGVSWGDLMTSEISAKELLRLYGRILDVYGAPVYGLSELHLLGSEFDEMAAFAKENATDFKTSPGIMAVDTTTGDLKEIPTINSVNFLNFTYDGYQWIVAKK